MSHEIGDMISKLKYISFATTLCGAGRVGGTHISGYHADNVAEYHLVLVHFVFAFCGGEIGVGGTRCVTLFGGLPRTCVFISISVFTSAGLE
jgi:hypothetical protein